MTFADDNRWKTERQAANAVIQGSAADIVQEAMVVIARDIPEVEIIAAVHDELLMEADPNADAFQDELVEIRYFAERGHGFELSLPLIFEPRVIDTWAEGKD